MLDGHQHLHLLPAVFEAVLELAAKYRVTLGSSTIVVGADSESCSQIDRSPLSRGPTALHVDICFVRPAFRHSGSSMAVPRARRLRLPCWSGGRR